MLPEKAGKKSEGRRPGRAWGEAEAEAPLLPAAVRARLDQREARALEGDLLYLRKGAGFTPARLVKTTMLPHLLGGADEPFEGLRERFISAIRSLRDPEPELLLTVFGLTPATAELRTLQERRRAHGRSIGRGADTVADFEPAALQHLRVQLTTGWYPLSPLPIRVPVSHNGVINEAVSVTTIVKDRIWQETREHYRFIAAFDEADYISVSSSIPGRVEVLGDDFSVRTEQIQDSRSHRFFSKEPMRRGESYDLRFRMVADPNHAEPEPVTEESRAFHEPTRLAWFRTVFIGQQPRLIWHYTGLTFLERPGSPRRDRLLTPDGSGSVQGRSYDLYGGLHHGIAWGW